VIAEYRRREAKYTDRVRELEAVTAQRDALRGEHDGHRKRRLDEFMAGFNVISLKLKEMYQVRESEGERPR
jgi:structural maintenance of chromosome 4